MDNNNNINNKNNPNRSQATTTSSSTDFLLQWGNRKRLRCMKQQQQQQLTKDEKLPLGQRSITARGDRRIANKDSLSNGGINLRQRSSSPAHRVLRNCESTTIGMKGGHQSNGDNKRSNKNNNNNGGGNGSGGSSETGAKSSGNEMMVWPPKFAIGLTNKEKEEDFLAIKGSKLPQRPKKRAKFIQRTINLVCPGGWLCDLTLERYEVREKKITKKRPRGLKAMGSIESESE